MDSDRQLVGRVVSGDRMAYRDLVTRYKGVVFGYCYFLARDQAAARTLARETFVLGFVEAASCEDSDAWLDFICKIARRLHRQGKKLKSSSIVSGEDAEAPAAGAGDLPDELLQAVAEELHAIDAEDRVAMTLRHAEGMTADEVGDVVGEAPQAVASRVSRGFKSVRDRLLTRMREGGGLRGV